MQTVQAFYPNNSAGFPIDSFEDFHQALPLITFITSLVASSFGMSKYFTCGPFPIIPNDLPLNGLASFPFLFMLMLNTMFGARMICIENAFFTSYRVQHYPPKGHFTEKTIDPIISTEYRLLVYFIPCFISFVFNITRLVSTGIKLKDYTLKHPQILIASCFTPFVFEGCTKDNQISIKIWKVGTILNGIFIGCLPQIILLIMDFYRGIVYWEFLGLELSHELKFEGNDSLFKNEYGNPLFAIISFVLFIIIVNVSFFSDKVFKYQDVSYKNYSTSQLNFSNPTAPLSNHQILNIHHFSDANKNEEELEEKPLRGKSFEANNVQKEKQMMIQRVTI